MTIHHISLFYNITITINLLLNNVKHVQTNSLFFDR